METTTTTLTVAERLESILSAVDSTPLREDLFNQFHILNPLEYARLLHSLNLPDGIKAQLLALKVGQKQPYKGTDLEPLIEKAMAQLWERLAEKV